MVTTVVVKATGPRVRIRGTGSVRVLTSKGIVKVPVSNKTDVKFSQSKEQAA